MSPIPQQRNASFILIPGAGGMASYWQRVAPLLEAADYEAIAVDLPGDEPSAGLEAYADIVVRAIGARPDVILVAQSLGGFTAPLVCARVPIRGLAFVNAMIPRPGETAGAWWENTGAAPARVAAARSGGYSVEFDVPTYFLHDVPEAVLRDGPSSQRGQSEAIFNEPCHFECWPRIPIQVISAAHDRFFPLQFQRRTAQDRPGPPRTAQDRLETDVEVVPGGHLVALSQP